jgi:hypothetical protein
MHKSSYNGSKLKNHNISIFQDIIFIFLHKLNDSNRCTENIKRVTNVSIIYFVNLAIIEHVFPK